MKRETLIDYNILK